MTAETIYQNVLLAAAAYADWGNDDNPDVRLGEEGFTESQITQFKNEYTVGNQGVRELETESSYI